MRRTWCRCRLAPVFVAIGTRVQVGGRAPEEPPSVLPVWTPSPEEVSIALPLSKPFWRFQPAALHCPPALSLLHGAGRLAPRVPLPRRPETRSGAPTGPREAEGPLRRAPRAGTRPARAAGWPGCPREGSGQRGPGASERWAPGRSGRAEPPGPGVARPPRWPSGSPRSACLSSRQSVGGSVCLRPGPAGRNPGKRALLTCSRRRPGSDRDAAPWVFLVGPLAGSGAALASGTARGSRARSPRRCRCRFRGRRLPVPSPSAPHARCWLPGGLRASAGGRAGVGRGEAAPRRRKKGCPLWGWGRRGEGAAARTAPPRTQPESQAPWPCALPAATWLRSARLQAPAGM